MKTYQDFKQINEAIPSDPLQDLEKQIDALFDELKQKLRSTTEPRQGWLDNLNKWYAKNKHRYEWTLQEYHDVTNYMGTLYEALTDPNVEAVLDEYKEKLKQIVRTYMSSGPQTKQRKPKAEPTAAPTPAEAPKTSVTPTAVTQPAEAPKTIQTQEPPSTVKPAEVPKAPVVTQPTEVPKAAQQEPEEDDKLARLGAAILLARDVVGDDNITPDDINHALKQPLNLQSHGALRDTYIKVAKAYKQQQSDSQAPTVTKDQIQPPKTPTPPAKAPIPDQPAPANQLEPSADDLRAMKPSQFKDWLLDHDPELAGAYEGEKWWGKSFRDELIMSYMRMRALKNKTTESLQYKVNKYKEMLRKEDRPEFLLHEATKVPFNERVAFYKKKLTS